MTAGASPLRRAVERRSAAALVFLRGLPRAAPALLVVVLSAGGVLLPNPLGPVLLLVVAAFLSWLVFLSWPAIDAPARFPRLVVIVVLLGGAVGRFLNG